MPAKDSKFRSVSISAEDYEKYERLMHQLNQELHADLSVAQVIRMGMTFYAQRRRLQNRGGVEKA